MKILIMLTLLLNGSVEEPDPVMFSYEVETQGVAWQKPCAVSSTKSYMDYTKIKTVTSRQYQYIQKYMTPRDGLLYDRDGSIGVALGSWWGGIGSKWVIELDNGTQLNVVKIDEKADEHVDYGCIHKKDKSVIEIVVDSKTTPKSHYGSNGLIWNGNFNNYNKFKGNIKRVGKLATFIEKVEIDVSKYFPPQPSGELEFEILNNILVLAP